MTHTIKLHKIDKLNAMKITPNEDVAVRPLKEKVCGLT